MTDVSATGIMDPAFFVGKNVLLKWINDFFQLNYTKVEQTATGAVHCQILDAVFPGKVPLNKVNFNAKYEYEFVQNFKILQTVFKQENISKHVPVDKLVKAKYQDNLEFCQWMKRFFDVKYGGQPYNAKERRDQAVKAFGKSGGPGAAAATTTTAKPPAAMPAKKPVATTTAPKPRTTATTKLAAKPVEKKATIAPPSSTLYKPTKADPKPPAASSSSDGEEKDTTIKSLTDEISKLTLTVEGLEKERNFYFDKLREIEILCQAEEGTATDAQSLKQELLKILYATDENEEFQSPDTGDADGTKMSETPGEGPTEKTLLDENVDDLLADLGGDSDTVHF